MSYLEKRANNILRRHVKNTFNKIEVEPGELHYNFRCHNNAVHYAIRNKHNRIAMVLYDSGTYISVHFINVYNKKKKGDYFVDNTIGEWSSKYDYYFVRWIMKEEFFYVGDVFGQFRKTLNKLLPFYYINTDYF